MAQAEANDGSEAFFLLPGLPQFNFIGPSRPPTPQQPDPPYLESAGLLDGLYHEDQPWLCDPGDFCDQPFNADSHPLWPPPILEPAPVLARTGSLEEQLLGALCENAHRESKGFIPLGYLLQLVNEGSVADALRACMPNLSDDQAWGHAQTICCKVQSVTTPSFRRIFAILVMIQQPREILTFINNNITDHDLPLVKGRSGAKGSYDLRRKVQPHTTLRCLQHWSSFLVNSFDEYQWTLLSPFFSRGNKGTVRFYPLDDRTILPFVEDSSRDSSFGNDEDFQGGHGSVFRVKIHRSHHAFHNTPVSTTLLQETRCVSVFAHA